jgi:hypothetical protein
MKHPHPTFPLEGVNLIAHIQRRLKTDGSHAVASTPYTTKKSRLPMLEVTVESENGSTREMFVLARIDGHRQLGELDRTIDHVNNNI